MRRLFAIMLVLLIAALGAVFLHGAPAPRPRPCQGDLKLGAGDWQVSKRGWPEFTLRLEVGGIGGGHVGTYVRTTKGLPPVNGRWGLPEGWLLLQEEFEGRWEPICLIPLKIEDREGPWAGDYSIRRCAK